MRSHDRNCLRRTVISTSLGLLLLASGTGEAVAGKPGMSYRDAQYYAGVALHRHFKGAWDYGYNRKRKCGAKLTAFKRRCRVQWIIGDVYFWGKVTIQFRGQYWYYGFHIIKYNEYCAIIGGSDCIKHYRVKL